MPAPSVARAAEVELPALGRSVVVAPGAPAPTGWTSCERVRVAAVDAEIADELGAAWRERRSLVVELVPGLGLDDPTTPPAEVVVGRQPWEWSVGLDLVGERLHHAVWANAVDARGGTGRHRWQWAEVALRLGYRAQVAEPSRAGTDVCWRVLVSEPHDYELASHRNISRVPYEGNVWCFHVRPHHLFFTRRNGRVSILANTGDTQIDVQFRVGTLPLIRHVEDVLNLFIRERLKLKARIQFDTGREVEDRLASAQAEQIYWEIGALSSDEIRMKLGKRISRERPTPRIFNNPRSGPIPILAVDSLAGKIDPTTYGPAKGQKPVTDPYVGAPGALAVSGSPDAKAATSATAALQAKMRGAPQPALPAAPDDTADAAKALEEAFGVIDVLLDQLAAKSEREEEFDHNDWDAEFGPDNTGGPGVHPEGEEEDAEKDATAGVSAETGIQGNPLAGTEDDDDEAVAKAVRRWRDNSRNRVRQNLPPKRFVDPRLPEQVADAIWRHLEKAHTRSQVDAVFGNWLGQDPADAVQKRALELLRPDIDRLMESAQRVDAAREALAGVE